jgi:hypothetical protein
MPWYDLVPDQTHGVVTAGLGTKGDSSSRVSRSDYLTAARTPDGAFVIAYMPTARTITVNMASLKSPANAQWFDPTSGVYIRVAGSPLANRGSRQFTPPAKNHEGDSDWVLVLDASGGRPGGDAGRASENRVSTFGNYRLISSDAQRYPCSGLCELRHVGITSHFCSQPDDCRHYVASCSVAI